MNSKKIKKILIISLEGIESNTEVNFFNGLFYHFQGQINGKCKALGKLGQDKDKREKFKNRIDTLIREISFFLMETTIFFIGDGFPQQDIVSMKRAFDFILFYFKDKKWKQFNIKFHKEIIYDEGKSFDNILKNNQKILDSKLFENKKHKKNSNRSLFNNIIEIIDPKILDNQVKLKEILLKIFKNSKFLKIINFLYD